MHRGALPARQVEEGARGDVWVDAAVLRAERRTRDAGGLESDEPLGSHRVEHVHGYAVPSLQAMDEQPFLQSVVERVETFGLRHPQDLHRLNAAQCDELRKVYWALVQRTVQLQPSQRHSPHGRQWLRTQH